MDNLEKKRYSRHILLDDIGETGQKKLINSKVLIVGFGGLGTGVSMFLARMGIGHLGIVDQDVVDLSNLQRQILYDERDIGISKIKAGVSKLKAINHNIVIDEYEFMLDSKNADSIISKYDIIVDCTDNYATRGLINRACVDNHKSCVFGGVNEFNGFVFTYIDGMPCFECLMGEYKKLKEMDENNKIVGVFGAMVGIISSMQALEVAKLILGIGSLSTNKMTIVDGRDLSTAVIPVSKKDQCYCDKG